MEKVKPCGLTTIKRLEAGQMKQNSSPEGDDFVHVVDDKIARILTIAKKKMLFLWVYVTHTRFC